MPHRLGLILAPNLVLFLVFLFISGCSTVGVKVPVLRPAEINLKGKKELVIGEMSGRQANKMSAYVKQKAVDSGYFKVIDRKHLAKVMAELKLSTSDLVDSDSRKKLGKPATDLATRWVWGSLDDIRKCGDAHSRIDILRTTGSWSKMTGDREIAQ